MKYIKFVMNGINNFPKHLWILFGVGFIIRIVGIAYGLPLQLNIDEPATVSTTIGLQYDLDPGRFDWPHLYYYMNGAIYAVIAIIIKILSLFTSVEVLRSLSTLFIVSRLFTAFLGALTIISVFFIAKELFKSAKIAYLSSIILVFLPVHVEESHFAKLDIAQAFFISITLYFIIKLYKTGEAKYYLLSGIFIGISTSIKYNAFLMAIPFALAIVLSANSVRDLFKKYVINNTVKAILLSLFFFYLGTPYALINFRTFWSYEHGKGALWQFSNVGTLEWIEYPQSVYETFVPMFRGDLGFGLWVLFSVLLILFLFFNKREKPFVLLLTPVILISFYISRFERSPSHYFVFLTPMYVVAVAAFISEIANWLNRKLPNIFKNKNISIILTSFIILVPSIYSVAILTYKYSRQDTRVMAYKWIKSNLDEDTDYLYVYGEDLESIPFQEDNSTRLKRLEQSEVVNTPFHIIIGSDEINEQNLLSGDKEDSNIPGSPEQILKHGDLKFRTDNNFRFGPPIYIYYVPKIDRD